jgi:thioredoxin 1
MHAVNVTDANFKAEVLESKVPVLVDFWASWCGPCKMIAPIIEDVAKECDKRLKVCKLNVDDNPKVATKYQVMSIPTLIFFKDGRVMDQVVGALGKADLKRKVEDNLA